MRVPYPKSAREIAIKESIIPNEDYAIPASARGAREMLLSDKIVEYLHTHDFGKEHILEIVMQSLTQGKVRVEFEDRFERIELIDLSDKISRTQVSAMVDDFLDEISRTGDDKDSAVITQRINLATKKTTGAMPMPAMAAKVPLPQAPPAAIVSPIKPSGTSTPSGSPQPLMNGGKVPPAHKPAAKPTSPVSIPSIKTGLAKAPLPAPEASGFMGKIKKLFGS
jgi:hypothetical protein